MKTIKLFLFIFFLSSNLTAQFSVIQPETFQLSKVSNYPCPIGHVGKIFYNTTDKGLVYCTQLATNEIAARFWEDNVLSNSINYSGKIGIRNPSPIYQVDVNGEIKATGVIADKLGINTNIPTEKVVINDGRIEIGSTTDSKVYRINYQDDADRLNFTGEGITRMMIANGGNIGIGNLPNSSKINVNGNVNYNGNLSVEGKGILTNTNSNQLSIISITSDPTSFSFTISNNSCRTVPFSFPSGSFSTTPVVVLSQNISGTDLSAKLTLTVESVTTTIGRIRVCNNTGSAINFSNQSFRLMAIGL